MQPRALTPEEYRQTILAPVGRVVMQMERTGVPVSLPDLADIERRMAEAATGYRAILNEWTGGQDINWNSWKQLAKWLHEDLKLPLSPYCKKGEVPDGRISTDDRALEWIGGHNPAHRAPINALRSLRQAERMARYARDWSGSVVHHADGTSRLHPTFGLGSDRDTRPGAKTGRFGVKNPALNQVPRNHDPAGMRRAFIAPPGMRLVVVDYSQLEVVELGHIIAGLFGYDDPLVSKLQAGEDIHSPTARLIFGELAGNAEIANCPLDEFKKRHGLERDLAKAGLYGKNYGKGRRGFATSVFLPSGEPLGMDRATLLDEGLNRALPGVPKYQDFVREFIGREGLIVSLFGRWMPLPYARADRMGLRNRAWRQALNYPMQAGGQEIMALALIAILADRELADLGYMVSLVVHDEIMGWAPEANAERALARVKHLMTETVQLRVPLKAAGHTGANWLEAK